MPSKGVVIFLSVFFILAIIGFMKGGTLEYEVHGEFDSKKILSTTMVDCDFKPTLESFGITKRLTCRSDGKNSIYGVQSVTSIQMLQGKR